MKYKVIYDGIFADLLICDISNIMPYVFVWMCSQGHELFQNLSKLS